MVQPLGTSADPIFETGSTGASASATGTKPFRSTTLSNTAVAIKTSPGNLYAFHFFNTNATDVYVQFYDLAAGSVTVGTTTPTRTFWLPGAGLLDDTFSAPMGFLNAITIAVTTTAAGGTAPGTAILANVEYL